LSDELSAFPKYLEEGLIGWKEWIRSLSYPMKYFDFDLSDFSNARVTAMNGARGLLGGLLRRKHIR
jgi:hypothetical protein